VKRFQLTPDNPGLSLENAAHALLAGGVIAAPTETVYGLMTLWDNPAGRERIYGLKRRPQDKRLQMLAPNVTTALRYGILADAGLRRLEQAFWPGPLTVVCRSTVDDTIGLRIPDHQWLCQLLKRCGTALAATSANLSGRPPATCADEAVTDLDGEPDLLVDGGTVVGGTASTVVDISGPDRWRILRPGPVSEAEIAAVLDT
jgi:L-threonylcarbamoyladenylate synthase